MNSNIEYLAIPYTDKSEKVKEFRANVADYIWYTLMKQNRIIYSPISVGHYIASKYDIPTSWKFWSAMDREFIKHCKKIIVVTLPGWKESIGVTAEIQFATDNSISIEYYDPTEDIEKMIKDRKDNL